MAALSLGSCSYIFPLDLVGRDGKLLIWTEREWKWFLIPHRPNLTVSSVEVWSGRRWVWRVESVTRDGIELPIAYGENRPGLKVLQPAQKLVAGLGYVAGVDGRSGKTFQLLRGGELRVEPAVWVNDPDDQLSLERRAARLRELRASGLSEAQAEAAWAAEQAKDEDHVKPGAIVGNQRH